MEFIYVLWSNGTSKIFPQSFEISLVKSLHNAVFCYVRCQWRWVEIWLWLFL